MSPLNAFECSKPTIASEIGPQTHCLVPTWWFGHQRKRADFTSNHRVAHNLFAQLSFFLQSDIHAKGHISKDGVSKIVDAVGVSYCCHRKLPSCLSILHTQSPDPSGAL